MASQSKQIESLNNRVKGLERGLEEKNQQINQLLKENQDLQNRLRDALFAAEERLKIISSLPNLNRGFHIKTLESKVRT